MNRACAPGNWVGCLLRTIPVQHRGDFGR
jgi:hypothetical protein